MTADRRAWPRSPLELKTQIDGPSGTRDLVARDLSGEGLFLETTEPLAVGEQVTCRIELTTPEGPVVISALAEVRHRTRSYQIPDGTGPYPGMGLQFIHIGPGAVASLRAFLSLLVEQPDNQDLLEQPDND